MRTLITLIICLCICLGASAQNHWMYLPNNGFIKGYSSTDTTRRIEDIYFTDTATGFAVTLTGRILKTTDGGYSWQNKSDTSASNYSGFRSIEFLDDGQHGIAGTLGATAKTWRTTDAGETWTDISSNISDTTTLVSSKKNICGLAHFGNTFYGVGSWGSNTGKLYKSTDKGQTWQTKYMDTNLIKGMVDIVFLSQDTGFVTGCRNKESVVLKTTDGGNSWTKVFGDTTIGGRIWKIQFLTHSMVYGSIEPYFSLDTVNMIYSTDGGNNWNIIHIGTAITKPGGYGTQGVGFATPAKGWVGGYYDGIFETTDSGKTWAHINFGYDFNRIFVIDSNHIFAGGHMPYKYGNWIPNSIKMQQGHSAPPHHLYPVSPNPSSGNVQVEFDLKSATNVVLNIIDIDGRRVYPVTNTYLSPGHYTYYWDGTNLPGGNYAVWLGTNEIPIVQKFILHK